jgi:tetratricopeptide (TPR) repeat protein
MKTLVATFLLTTLFLTAAAQSAKYEQAMGKALESLNNASMADDFINAANTFERISMNEKNEWLPLYYSAYAYIVVCYVNPDKEQTDAMLDKAQSFVDRALAIAPEESELFALQAFLYPARITVDPMARGAEYIGKMNQALDEAIKLNPENPRSYYLRAITTLNMPEAFGGGAAAAKPIFETAKEKFDKFTPETKLSPDWGKEQNEQELSKL